MERCRIVQDPALRLYHVELSRDMLEGAHFAVTPGAPERAAAIAARLEDPRQLSDHRGLAGYLGRLNGVPVLVQSTGMGGPSTEIVVQELLMLGIDTFLRVGTTGSIQPEVAVGTTIITEAAVRLDGTSDHYLPPAFPAVADLHLTYSLLKAAQSLGMPYACGLTVSSASFYAGQERYDSATGYVPRHLQGSLEEWRRLGVLNYEMEAATLFALARSAGARAGCVCGAIAQRSQSESPARDRIHAIEEQTITVALAGLSAYTESHR